jgi:hypothetical protein
MDGNPAEELPVNWPDPGGAMEPGAIPDVRELFYPVCLEVAARHGLKVGIVRLTEHPMAVDGLVVDLVSKTP